MKCAGMLNTDLNGWKFDKLEQCSGQKPTSNQSIEVTENIGHYRVMNWPDGLKYHQCFPYEYNLLPLITKQVFFNSYLLLLFSILFLEKDFIRTYIYNRIWLNTIGHCI